MRHFIIGVHLKESGIHYLGLTTRFWLKILVDSNGFQQTLPYENIWLKQVLKVWKESENDFFANLVSLFS